MSSSSELKEFEATLLRRIISFLFDDRKTLYALCLSKKSLNSLASQALYAKISISSTLDILRSGRGNQTDLSQETNDSHGDEKIVRASAFACSLLPRYALYVREFEMEVAPLYATSWSGLTPISSALKYAFAVYTNLLSFIWRPSFCDPDLLLAVAQLLPQLSPHLQCLSIKVPFVFPPLPPPVSLGAEFKTEGLNIISEEYEDEEGKRNGDGESDKDLQTILQEMPPYTPLNDSELASGVTTTEEQPLCIIPPLELRHLQHLKLASPTPEVLVALPNILMSLNKPLASLYFEEDCGSVTPGILTSLLPAVRALRSFALGVAFSVKYDDLFPFLEELVHLRHLELFHYSQLRDTSISPSLRMLRTLKIVHDNTASRRDVTNMCVWMRRLVRSSPLESLEIGCDDPADYSGSPYIGYEGLLEHLICCHAGTLRCLKVEDLYAGTRMVKRLVQRCTKLEELELCVGLNCFNLLGSLLASAQNLSSVRLSVVNTKVVAVPDRGLLQEGSTGLRRIIVNKCGFEGRWISEWNVGQPPQAVFRVVEVRPA
ncbi:hypothetical protein M0805_003944 [Coniferiporia weirii]|nr:hypothetical protein M0805_003944 [Coniferiporia weirii]